MLLNVLAEVVGVLVVGVGPASIILVIGGEVNWRLWNFIEWDIGVLGIAHLFKFDVGHLLVADD